ncbi:nuclear transport factor 2 family protein [Ilumatobacter sp.]|uniref:nuclear transport factor 2 family protein n=1 Tax=Ilumatobacter sp. TaxID=1967498 RepID=UPI00375282B3
MTDDLAARIQRLEDRVELRELTIKYCAACDDRDVDGLAQLFAAEGAFIHDDGTVNVTGRQSIHDFYSERLSAMGPSVHLPYNQIVEFSDNNHGTGVVQAAAEMGLGGVTVMAKMRYHDDYVREQGAWRFARRRLRFWYMQPFEDLKEGLSGSLRRRWPGEPMASQLPETLASWQSFYGATDG